MKRRLEKFTQSIIKLFSSSQNYQQFIYYSSLVCQYDDFESYLTLYKRSINNGCIKTDIEICFSKLLTFGSSIKSVKKNLSKPNYHRQYNKFLNTEILFYRIMIGNHKVKCQMHFHKDKLFLYNYTFANTNENENYEIVNILEEKYGTNLKNLAKQSIIDNNNNCVQIDDNVELKINYFSLTSDFFINVSQLSEEEEQLQRKKNVAHFHDLYSRV